MNMYRLLLIILLAGITGCATGPEVIDGRNKKTEKSNDRLDQINIHQIYFNKDTTELEHLIDSGKIDLKNDRTIFNNTITHIMSNCNLDALKLVLDKGAPLDDVNTFGDTPLSIAVSGKTIECAKELLNRGARVNGKFGFDNPLIHIASKNNQTALVKLLIQYNACPLDNGFIDTPVLEIFGLTEEIKTILKEYIASYQKKFGNKCPVEKPLLDPKNKL